MIESSPCPWSTYIEHLAVQGDSFSFRGPPQYNLVFQGIFFFLCHERFVKVGKRRRRSIPRELWSCHRTRYTRWSPASRAYYHRHAAWPWRYWEAPCSHGLIYKAVIYDLRLSFHWGGDKWIHPWYPAPPRQLLRRYRATFLESRNSVLYGVSIRHRIRFTLSSRHLYDALIISVTRRDPDGTENVQTRLGLAT